MSNTLLTPRWFRRLVGRLSGRESYDLVVRARSAAIAYFAIGVLAGLFVCHVISWW